jgi:hypothetical protein
MPRSSLLDITGHTLRESLYEEAVKRGLIKQGDELRLDVDRACDLLGATRPREAPDLSTATRVGSILAWFRDNPHPDWLQEHVTGRYVVLYLRPRRAKPHANPNDKGGALA